MKKQVKYNKVKGKIDSGLVQEIDSTLEELGIDKDNVDVLRKDWVELDTKALELEEGSRSAIKYVSTRTVDQSGDIIIPKGVQLDLFKKTGMPVFWGHDYSKPPIGSDEWVKKDDWGIKVKTVFADTGPGTLADILWKLVQQGHQKQSSVGIIPLEVIVRGDANFNEAIKVLKSEYPELNKTYKDCYRIITKCILFEHSLVSLACNTDTDVLAVSKMFKDNGADEKLLKQLGFNKVIEEEVDKEEVIEISVKVPEIKGVENEKIQKSEEIKVEEIKKKVVNLVKQPRIIKLIALPQPEINIKELAEIEIKRRLGRIV